MTNYDLRNKKLYNTDTGEIVLVQIGDKFFTLKEEKLSDNPKAFSKILERNDVYLLTKGD